MEEPNNGQHPLPDSGRPLEDGTCHCQCQSGNVAAALKPKNGDPAVRGRDVVIVAADEFGRPLQTGETMPFVTFMEGLDVAALDLTRERGTGRDVALCLSDCLVAPVA